MSAKLSVITGSAVSPVAGIFRDNPSGFLHEPGLEKRDSPSGVSKPGNGGSLS